LDLLLEPVVGISQVTWLPEEIELGEGAGKGLNGIVLPRGEGVCGTGANVGSQSFLRSISLVVGLKDIRRLTLPIVPISTTTAMVYGVLSPTGRLALNVETLPDLEPTW